ncbi:WAT1-related protein [Platanthera zijinensis]|uniref:WAT1-related protein n=1 Tax=Platanthera zijinensis TaxID=2320716 RepID=A0AAP0B865_9ASPA
MLQRVKPYAAMILLQLSYAVMYVVLLATLKNGMNQPVLLVYRNSVAAIFMIPFALWFERPVLDQNFYFMGAKQTSAGFASALENINPSIAFVMALLFRVEKMDIRQRHGQAKIIGAGVTIAGTILMILYKGPAVELFLWSNGRQPQQQNSGTLTADKHESNDYNRINGILMLLVSCFSWTSFLLLQVLKHFKVVPGKSEPKHLYLFPGRPDELCDGSAGRRSELGTMDFRLGHEDFCSGLLGGGLQWIELLYSGDGDDEERPGFCECLQPSYHDPNNYLELHYFGRKDNFGNSKGDHTPLKNGGKAVEELELPVTAPSEQRPVEMIAGTNNR